MQHGPLSPYSRRVSKWKNGATTDYPQLSPAARVIAAMSAEGHTLRIRAGRWTPRCT
jgi:hypothetical protein